MHLESQQGDPEALQVWLVIQESRVLRRRFPHLPPLSAYVSWGSEKTTVLRKAGERIICEIRNQESGGSRL